MYVIRRLGLALLLLLSTAFAPTPALAVAEPAAPARESLAFAAPLSRARPSVVVFAHETQSPAKGKLIENLARERGVDLDYVIVENLTEDALRNDLAGRDLVLMDWPMDAPATSQGTFSRLLKAVSPALSGFEGKVWGGLEWERADLTRGLTPEQCQRLMVYLRQGGARNEASLADYIRTDIFGLAGEHGAEPVIMPEAGIYHPDAPNKIFASIGDYLAWRSPAPGQHVIAIHFYRTLLSSDTLLHIDDLVRRIESKGAVALPYWSPESVEKVSSLLTNDGKVLPDAIVTFGYVFTSNDAQAEFAARSNLPIMQAMVAAKEYDDDWRAKPEGISSAVGSYYYDLGEKAGRIDATMVAAKRRGDEQLVAMPEQADALVERALAQANLRTKPNKDKKLALFLWNSPPGEENFQASYLNVPASLVEVVKALRQEGYDIPSIDENAAIENIKKLIRPYYRTKDDAELRELLAAGLADRVPVAEYKEFIAKLPADMQKALAEGWEKPEDTYLTLKDGDNADFIVPRWKLGNLMILPQPVRGARRSEEADILHDRTRPLHHAYRAVYYDMVHKQKVDAIIHFGTHGTQEFLLGKERAPSVWDDTQTTIGNVPVVYPYVVDNPGEAITAKRRGRATIISHDDPPYAPSGLYGELSELHDLLNQYESVADGLTKSALIRQIREKAVKLGVDKDVAMSDVEIAADHDKFVKRVDRFLHSAAQLPQPLGLRTFGVVAPTDKVLMTVLQILGPDYIKAFGKAPSIVTSEPYQNLEKNEVFVALRRAVVDNENLANFPEKARPFLEQARQHFANFTHPMEMQDFVKALAGGFIPTSTGNDPIRNPDAVPTGRNLHGFDPRKIPTKAAWEAGSKLARKFMNDYREKHGVWPDKVAYELWQVETIRHFGVVEAQILYMLGAEPVWNERGEVTGSEIIPREKLDRPRVDTVLSLGGIYRDNLPELMQLLQGAVNKVADLDAKENPVALNVQKTIEALLARGVDEERARRLAQVRLFSNESGVYGSKLAAATVASGMWENDKPLAEVYLDRMSYAYGLDADTRNVKLEGTNLYSEALRGTKAAVLSRSSNAYGVINTDDPFQYLGGLGLAVRHLDGKTPELFLSDLRDTRDFKNKTLAEFISVELRAQMFHPRYIKELMDERYAGANRMAYNLNNFWGWNVMDPSSVRADQWQEFYEVYVKDKYKLDLKEFFLKNHPAALAQMSERMLEAVRKGYWNAPEEVVRTLVETHEEIAKMHDLHVSNEKFAEFVKAKAAGFGLLAAAAAPTAAAAPSAEQAAARPQAEEQQTQRKVTGVKLERQEAAQPVSPSDRFDIYTMVLGSFGGGIAWEVAGAWLRRRRLV